MWEETDLEKYLNKSLSKKLSSSDAANCMSHYESARAVLVENVLEEIKAIEPNLSDHGPRHIKDVMENAWEIVKDKDKCPVEMYILCISILYHDVGNIRGRAKHNQRIAEIFNKSYNKDAKERKQLRSLILKIAGAHTGKGSDGTKNTLKFLGEDHYFQKKIDTQEIASVLRFADEISEGQQRTSSFRLSNNLFAEDSKKFHIYADCCTQAHVDRSNKRIAIKYNIPVQKIDGELFTRDETMPLNTLLDFVFERIVKLDQERKYCKHYSKNYLLDFRKTSIAFEFWLDDEDKIDFVRPPLVLDDLVVPGDEAKTISKRFPEYDVTLILSDLKEKIDA